MHRLNMLFPYLLLTAITGVVVATNISGRKQSVDAVAATMHVCEPCGIEVDPQLALIVVIDGKTKYFCNSGCRDAAQAKANDAVFSEAGPLVDVVCKMEVNAAWGIESTFNGKTYAFCTHRCRELFDLEPERFLLERCLVCETPLLGDEGFPATYLGTTYQLCSSEHHTEFKRDPAGFFMHTMWGIPSWLYYGSIAVVLVVSFGVFGWLSRRGTPAIRPSPGPNTPVRIDREGIRGEGERLVGSSTTNVRLNSDGSIALPVLIPTESKAFSVHPSFPIRAFLLMEGPKVVAMMSDPLGWGWNLFGTGRAAFRSQLPMLVGMIGFSVFSLWLLKQPMEMRTSAM